MYHIGICDDGMQMCSSLEKMISEYCHKNGIQVDVKVWYTGEVLRDYLEKGNHLDILFLDIELLEMSGIEVGKYIRELLGNREMQIVYISGKSAYATQLFKTQPMDFLIKPISQEQVDETLELAFKIIKKTAGKFEFQNGKEYFYVPLREIMYFCSEGRKVIIKTTNRIYEFYGKLKDIKCSLPEEFVTIHQSYIVNKEHIVKYRYETVELFDETVIPISKIHRKNVRKMILKDD